jgi:hypothetical protein
MVSGVLESRKPIMAALAAPVPTWRHGFQRLRAGLRDLGYVEGQNIFIDFRWAEGNYSRLVEFAPITTPKSNHITDFITVPETLQVRGCRS